MNKSNQEREENNTVIRSLGKPQYVVYVCSRKYNSVAFYFKSQESLLRVFCTLFESAMQGRIMVYGLRAQSPKYDWNQRSEERAQNSEEWDQGSQGF